MTTPANHLLSKRAPMKTLDFSQHILRFGFHFKIRKFAVLMVLDSHFVLNCIQHLQHPRQLMFGKQADVQVQVGTMLDLHTQAVLGNDHKCGKEDRFQRYDHCQESVRECIEWTHAKTSAIEKNPKAKPHDM